MRNIAFIVFGFPFLISIYSCFFNDNCSSPNIGEIKYSEFIHTKFSSLKGGGTGTNNDGIVVTQHSNLKSGSIMYFNMCQSDTCWLSYSESYNVDNTNPRKWHVFFAGSTSIWEINIANKSEFSYQLSSDGCPITYSSTTGVVFAYRTLDSIITF